MSYTWVVVADSIRARFFSAEAASAALDEFTELFSPENQQDNSVRLEEIPSRGIADIDAGGRHDMVPTSDPRQEQTVEFAREIAHYLDAARMQGDFEQVVIVAAPSILGLIREKLSDNCRKLVAFELNKNLVCESAAAIRAYLPKRLPAVS